MKKAFVWILALSFAAPQLTWAQQDNSSPARASRATLAAPQTSQGVSGKPGSSSASQNDAQTSRSRSYQRETSSRSHRSGISKKEAVFLVAVAGTSMGIGALAGGAEGLAIGAIVGGWGAYAGHRLWRWIR